ncbi:MAG: gamma-glutamylcyclotransferase family protein [Polyangiaceae bacterium]
MPPPTPPAGRREFLLFVYDAWMTGQPSSARLEGARSLGPAATPPTFDLVDLGRDIILVPGGQTEVKGELFSLDPTLLASLDIEKGHPLRFKRVSIQLADGQTAHAYTLDPDQVRGRRRIRSGDYKEHAAPAAPPQRDGAWSRWAKSRASGR